MQTQDRCSDGPILAMLESDAKSEQFKELLQHVERCSYCQQRLDDLAASDVHWSRATLFLSGFSSNDVFRSLPGSAETPSSRRGDYHGDWTESMARQLLSPASHPEMLGRIGRYEVERLIGSGGMGIVFKAIDTELNRPVAIKILAPYLAGSGAARQRFAREAKAAAAVVHEHVVPIHNVETDGQSPFLVMRYVAGESLQARIDREGALDVCQVLRIAHQIASGLSAAHSHGLIHRDIKPSNILVESGVERSLITDFGLARAADDASLTNTGYHPGTPQFMSPEQACGDAIDARSDLFSLGSVMYTMCTGRPPFRAETTFGILRRITDTQPRQIQELNPQIPDWLCGIIGKLMSKSLEERYQSSEHVSKLLELCLAHVQQPATYAFPAEAAQFQSNASRKLLTPVKLIGIGSLVLIAVLLISRMLPTSVGKTNLPVVAPAIVGDLDDEEAREKDSPSAIDEKSTSPARKASPSVVSPRRQVTDDPADRVRQQLSVHTEVDFRNGPLQEAVAAILKTSGVRFQFLDAAFDAADIDRSATFSFKASESTRSLLDRICQRYQASYIVRDSSIEIVPWTYAQDHPTLRYYDLAFVVPDNRSTQAVIGVIEQTIEPNQWGGGGGTFSIGLVDSVIVVRASESAHLEIERLLSQLVLNSHPTSLNSN